MIVNPSINISIGDHGEKYLTSFHDYFNEHENELSEFASFYRIFCRENKVSITSDENSFSDSIELSSPINDRSDLHRQLSEQRNTFAFEEFINSSYIQIVNLFNQRASLENVYLNFDIINFNVIISGFEEYNSILLEALVNSIKKLSDVNLISSASIKTFIVLPKDEHLLSREEQINSYRLFKEISVIRNKATDVFDNIIFIDDRNTETVFLGINEKSIGFVLNEFITYLMTNHYKMIGNLMNSEYISLGLGTLFFDYSYFKTFFRHKIISKQMSNEGFFRNKPNDIKSINEISKIIKPYIVQGTQNEDIQKKINTIISEVEGKKNAVLEYKYILAAILGRYDDLPGSNEIYNRDKISLPDLIFNSINEFLSFTANGSDVNILDHKKLLDDIKDLEIEFDRLSKRNESNIYVTRLNAIKDEIAAKSELAKKQSSKIEQALSDFRNSDYQEKIANEIVPEIDKEIQTLKIELTEIQNVQISFLQRIINFFSRRNEKKKNIETCLNKINNLKNNKLEINSLYATVNSKTEPLFNFIKELEWKYNILSDTINEFRRIANAFENDFSDTDLIQYIFVRNVIDKEVLSEYFINHQTILTNTLKGLSGEISNLYSIPNPVSEFGTRVYSKIDDTIKSIIDFNILNYLNGDYDKMKLFDTVDFQNVIRDLLNMSLPFINTDHAHDTDNSHVMVLHNHTDEIEVQQLDEKLSRSFTASKPQNINTLNNHKFSIIKVDLIKDFDHMVKYNLCKNTYSEEGSDTILIK